MTTMKLRNLILGSLVACTLASCSKDDEGGAGTPQDMDAYLSIAAVSSDLGTKASSAGNDETGELKERVVNTLTAFVFSEDGKFVISKKVSADDAGVITETVGTEKSVSAITGIHVKVKGVSTPGATTDTKFKVVLVANMDVKASSLTDLEATTTPDIKDIGAIGTSYLPMSSIVLTIENIKPVQATESLTGQHTMNWYNGGNLPVYSTGTDASSVPAGVTNKVVLTRAISRVQIESLQTAFIDQYADASFTVDSIYLVNLRATETIMGKENTTAGYYRGGLADYSVLDKLINPNSTAVTGTSTFWKKYTADNVLSGTSNKSFADFKSYMYVNEASDANGQTLTRLIIAGDLKLKNGQEMGRKYFHIPLKDIVGGSNNVANNKIYKIIATITGEGNPDPDRILENACINFTVKVDNWKVVNQTEDDVN